MGVVFLGSDKGGSMRAGAAAIGVLVALGALGGLAHDASGTPSAKTAPSAPAAPSTAAGLVDKVFCDLIGNKEVQAGGLALLGHFIKKTISTTSIYTTAALTSVSVLCKPVMKRAARAVARFLGIAPRPKEAPTRSDFASSFGQATAESVSAQLRRIGWNRSPANVDAIKSELCYVVRRGQDPQPTLRKWFVNGKLDSLRALNGLVAYAATCRPGLTPLQLSYLTSSVTSYLTDNTFRPDYTPPVTMLYRPSETLLDNGLVRVNFRWLSFDFNGRVAKQALFIDTNGRWWPLSRGVAFVRPRQLYRLATRARDTAENWSAWVFTPPYRARAG
jgi:hypothetical protein